MATYTAGKSKMGYRAAKKKGTKSKSGSSAPYRGGMIGKTASALKKSSKKGMKY